MAVRHARNTKWLAATLAVALAPWSAAYGGALEDQLFQSVRNNDLAAVRSALDGGANVFATNVLGNRAADVAVDLGHFDVAHYLLSVMDHVRAAREAREEPAVVVPDTPPVPASLASPEPVTARPAPRPVQPAPKPAPAFDAAAADAVFTPVRAPVAEKAVMRDAEMPTVPKILPAAHEVSPPQPVPAESAPQPEEKTVVAVQASASASEPVLAPAPAQNKPAPKPKRTLDDIMRTASKADSTLHVQPGTPVAKPPPPPVPVPVAQAAAQAASPQAATPQPVGLFAKGAPPQSSPQSPPQAQTANMEVAGKPASTDVKTEASAMRKASVLHVAAGSAPKPAGATDTAPDAQVRVASEMRAASVRSEPPKAAQVHQTKPVEASRPAEEDQGWFAKMKSYLGVGETAEPEPAPTSPAQSAASAQGLSPANTAAPVQTAALTPPAAKAQTPSHRGPSPYKITADLALGRALPYDDLKGAPCVDKRRQGVVCMEPASWPKDLAPYFADMRSALYRGTKVVVGYRGEQASFLYAVFPSTHFKAVVGALSGRFGPPIKSQRGVRPLGEELQANLVRIWSGTDETTGRPVTLEVSLYDDQRGTFPVMDEGVLKLTYTGSDSVFRYVEPMELQRFK